MDGPRRRARRYLAPVRILLGLYDVWNIAQRKRDNLARVECVTVAMSTI